MATGLRYGLLAGFCWAMVLAQASGAELKVLTAGVMKEVVLSVVPEFERQTGDKVSVLNDTAGALQSRIGGGEAFDIVVVPTPTLDRLAEGGHLRPDTRTPLARVGIGVMVRAGAPHPDVSTVDGFKRALLEANSVAYIDPDSGGSSGIYLVRLFEKLGIADQIKAKAKLKRGGYVADLIVSGEAELGIHQISEILAVEGVDFVGPLPAEIQNYTPYSGGVSSRTAAGESAALFVKLLAGPEAETMMKSRGLERPGQR